MVSAVDAESLAGFLKCSQPTTIHGYPNYREMGNSITTTLSYDKKTAERETLRKRNKWSVWATHVKQVMEEVMEDTAKERS
jgi:hypothetical protein